MGLPAVDIVKPPFSYMGAKTRLTPELLQMLGPHRCYTETFGGSFALLFAKAPAAVEVANDLDDNLLTFWRVLRDDPEALVDACRLTPHSRAEHRLEPSEGETDLERARRVWVRFTQGFMPTMENRGWQGVPLSPTSRRILRRCESLGHLAYRLRHVTLENRPATQVIQQWDSPSTVHYVDPPYVMDTRTAEHAEVYVNEMTDDDHRELAKVLHGCAGRVVLSGYPGALYDELYADWDTFDFVLGKQVSRRKNGAGNGATAIERVWINQRTSALTLF